MTTFIDFARTILDRRSREGIRGIYHERNRFETHIENAPFAAMPLADVDFLRSRQSSLSQCADFSTQAVVIVDAKPGCGFSVTRSRAVHFVSSCRSLTRRDVMVTSTPMPKAIDLTGLTFNHLHVLRFTGSRHDGGGHPRRMYLVRCDCGVEKELPGIYIASGNTKSCGCLKHDAERCVTHGETRGGWTPEYRAWQSMISRCHRTGSSGYVKYGAKGTTVCAAWRESYEVFLAHVGRKPSRAHSLDRIDPWGHYEPGNVRWATPVEQMNNQRRHHPRPS